MRVKITRVQFYEFEDCTDMDQITDSMNDSILDEQDSICETSDAKLNYTPGELVELKIENACEHEWIEQPGEPPTDVCYHCGQKRE